MSQESARLFVDEPIFEAFCAPATAETAIHPRKNRAKSFLRAISFTILLVLSAQVPASAADFVPEQVFAGRSTGKGELRLIFRKPQRFTVESNGESREDAALVLHQQIHFQGRAVQSRTWVMQRRNAHEYTATLTDAAGPVVARVDGSRLTLRYALNRWGLRMHQTLDLSEDGNTVANHGRIKLLGIPVGELLETIHLMH